MEPALAMVLGDNETRETPRNRGFNFYKVFASVGRRVETVIYRRISKLLSTV